jgi:Glycosyl hydrolase family 79, N-terminal domain
MEMSPAKSLSLFLGAWLLSSAATAQTSSPPDLIRIQVSPEVMVARTSEQFIGLGYETSALARPGYFAPGNSHLVQLLRTLSHHGLIRIGGNVSDYAKYVPNAGSVAAPEGHTTQFNQSELTDLGAFLRKTGWKVMWGLNLKTGTAAEAVQEAAAVQKALGDHLQSFEVGNETDIQPQLKKNPDAYLSAYREFKSALRATLPQALFSGPDAAWDVHWVQSFARNESPGLQLLTRHYYRCGAGNPEATIQNLLLPDPKWERDLDSLQAISTEAQVPFRINEINSFFGGGKAGVSDTFASGLWCLDTTFMLAARGCDGLNLETDINQKGFISHYSPIFRDQGGHLIARPEYYGILAFSLAGVGDVVQTSFSTTAVNVKAYGVRTRKRDLWVTVINKELSKPSAISLTLSPSYSKAACFRLMAPSVESTSHVTLGGAEISPDGTWKPAQVEAIPVEKGKVNLSLPAATAALIRLR